jgi:hypothetical protein
MHAIRIAESGEIARPSTGRERGKARPRCMKPRRHLGALCALLVGPGAHDAGDCPTALRRAPSTSGASLVTAACERARWGRNTSGLGGVLQRVLQSWWLHGTSCRATPCSRTATARDAMIVGARVGCVEGLRGGATDCRAFVLSSGGDFGLDTLRFAAVSQSSRSRLRRACCE